MNWIEVLIVFLGKLDSKAYDREYKRGYERADRAFRRSL